VRFIYLVILQADNAYNCVTPHGCFSVGAKSERFIMADETPQPNPVSNFFTNGIVQGSCVFIALAVALSGKISSLGSGVAILIALVIGVIGLYAHISNKTVRYPLVVVWIIALGFFYSYLTDKPVTAQNSPAQPKPQVNQESKGDNSPNQNSSGNNSPNTVIINHNNRVINGDPKAAAKFDEILAQLKKLNVNANPDALLEKYPLGYVLFDIDKSNRVFPYTTEPTLRRWSFDWSNVHITKANENEISLNLPDMRSPNGSSFSGTQITGPAKVGPFGGFGAVRTPDFIEVAEILTISDKGTVFVLGFVSPK
jgi:hypothetical protein